MYRVAGKSAMQTGLTAEINRTFRCKLHKIPYSQTHGTGSPLSAHRTFFLRQFFVVKKHFDVKGRGDIPHLRARFLLLLDPITDHAKDEIDQRVQIQVILPRACRTYTINHGT